MNMKTSKQTTTIIFVILFLVIFGSICASMFYIFSRGADTAPEEPHNSREGGVSSMTSVDHPTYETIEELYKEADIVIMATSADNGVSANIYTDEHERVRTSYTLSVTKPLKGDVMMIRSALPCLVARVVMVSPWNTRVA